MEELKRTETYTIASIVHVHCRGCGVGEAHDGWCARPTSKEVASSAATLGSRVAGADDHVRSRFKLKCASHHHHHHDAGLGAQAIRSAAVHRSTHANPNRAHSPQRICLSLLVDDAAGPDRLPCCAGKQKAFSDDKMMKKSRGLPDSFTTIPRRPASHAERGRVR
jgi:hypothetical protein